MASRITEVAPDCSGPPQPAIREPSSVFPAAAGCQTSGASQRGSEMA